MPSINYNLLKFMGLIVKLLRRPTFPSKRSKSYPIPDFKTLMNNLLIPIIGIKTKEGSLYGL